MANYERQVEVVMPPEEAMHRLYGVLASLPGASQPRVDGAWIITNIGVSMWSCGETVTAYVQPGPGRCLLTVQSKSAFTLVDWGKNKKNVETALARLHQQPA